MALRDTSWCYDTSDTGTELQTANANTTQSDKNTVTVYFFPFGNKSQTRTVVTDEWINMTEAGAKSAVAQAALDSNYNVGTSFKASEVDRVTGCWKVTRIIDSNSAWS